MGEEKEEPNVMLRIYNFICLNGSNSVTTKIKLKIKEYKLLLVLGPSWSASLTSWQAVAGSKGNQERR